MKPLNESIWVGWLLSNNVKSPRSRPEMACPALSLTMTTSWISLDVACPAAVAGFCEAAESAGFDCCAPAASATTRRSPGEKHLDLIGDLRGARTKLRGFPITLTNP